MAHHCLCAWLPMVLALSSCHHAVLPTLEPVASLSSFVGTDYRSAGPMNSPLPITPDTVEGRWLGGHMVANDWGIDFMARGQEHIILLSRAVSREQSGVAVWRSEAVARVTVPKGYHLWRYTCSARDARDWDSRLLAIVKDENKRYLDNAIAAWRVDVETPAFVPINPSGIRCEVEAFGE